MREAASGQLAGGWPIALGVQGCETASTPDLELQRAVLRRAVERAGQQDVEALIASWRAIVRSHSSLDRPVYKSRGELRVEAHGGQQVHHGPSADDQAASRRTTSG
jgi:hypothetical protein